VQFIIADDHPLYLDAACRQISRTFRKAVVRPFNSFDAALASLSAVPADLIMLDYSMPGMNGADGVRRACDVSGDASIIVMSGVALGADVAACIAAGARGFLPKTMEGKVFTDAVSLVLHGGTYIPAEFVGGQRGGEALVPSAPMSGEDGKGMDPASFSARERELLQLIIAGSPNKDIARRLGLQEVTVKFYLTRLFRRLGVKNRSQAAVEALRLGFGQTP